MAAGKAFHAKITHPHQMWATDASYFRVCGWGFYDLVTVMETSHGSSSPGGSNET